MKKTNLFVVITGLFCALFAGSCYVTTQVSGRITNLRNGNPVVGMDVALWVYNGHDPQDSANPKKVGESETVTDENGEYFLEYNGSGIDHVNLLLNGGWPCTAFFESIWSAKPVANRSREVNIQIDSIDGRLHLNLENQTGLYNQIHLRVDCDATGEKGFYCSGCDYGATVPAGNSDEKEFKISASRYVKVYWGTEPFSVWNSPNVDSVFCPAGQVTPLIIAF